MLNPDQFAGVMLPADEVTGPVRDLTSARISTKSTARRDRVDAYRNARHQYSLRMEETAIGYKPEEKEYREHNPPPSWKGFLQEGFH